MKRSATAFGLALLTAVAMMAVVGASAASAKVCSTTGTGESSGAGHGNKIYNGTAIKATATNATLTSGFIRVTCGHSEVAGSITNNASPATGSITSMTFSDCHSNLNTTTNSCSASTTASAANPWPASVATGSSTNGTMTVSNITGSFTCSVFGSSVTCRYTAASASTAVTGGEPATVTASKVAMAREEVSSGSCSATAEWHGTYTVTSPATLFVT
jgi:hypothetical protein